MEAAKRDGTDNIMFGKMFIDENGKLRIMVNKEEKFKFDAHPQPSMLVLETDKEDETKTDKSDSEEVLQH